MVTKRLHLTFPSTAVEEPIVYHLVRDYNLLINIVRANITPDEEGYLALNVTGTEEDIQRGIAFAQSYSVVISEITKGLIWDSNRCTSCSNCITHCPTNALHIADRKTMKVAYDSLLCVECMSCIRNCPYGVCTSYF